MLLKINYKQQECASEFILTLSQLQPLQVFPTVAFFLQGVI